MQDQVSSNGGERGCMSGTCVILDTTVGGQVHTLAGQELAGMYWVTLKISSRIYFVSVTDGGRRLENGFSSETESVLQTDQQYKAEGNVSAAAPLPLFTSYTSQIMFTPRISGLSASVGIRNMNIH